MVSENYKCEKCNYIIENVEAKSGDKLPKRKKCPKCKTLSCHRVWGCTIKIPADFQAMSKSGAKWAKKHMKHAKSPSGRTKRFY